MSDTSRSWPVEDWPRGDVILGTDCVVAQPTILGLAKELNVRAPNPPKPTSLGDRVLVGAFVIIHEGTLIEADCFIDDCVRVGYDCRIGAGTRIEYGGTICDRVTIGEGSVVGGFVCDGSRIGNDTVMLGSLVHELSKPISTDWGIEEPAPRVADRAVVGIGALVVGGIDIGEGSYVAAGAIVTKTVPPEHVVIGVNQQIPRDHWRGERLERLR